MNTIAERIEYVRRQKGKSYRELSEYIGDITGDALRKAIQRNKVKEYYINIISDKLRISKKWILTGNGDMEMSLNLVTPTNLQESKEVFLEKDGVQFSIDEISKFIANNKKYFLDDIAIFAAKNIEELKEQDIFYNTLIIESLKLLKQSETKDGKYIDTTKLVTLKKQ